MLPDRRVHARWKGIEVVRYDRAGKWYLEEPDRRERISFNLATAYGRVALDDIDSAVFFGVPGGSRFDSEVKRAS